MINSLSGKVSTEALTALQALMDKHKAEMIAARSNTGTIDKTAMEAQRTAFKAEIDALFAKYPELKTAMPTPPNGGMMMGREGRGGKQMETIIATLPSSAQTELQAIRDDYRTKQEALRTEEKTKTDAILASYPDIKTKLDALQKGHGPMENSRDIASKSNGQ